MDISKAEQKGLLSLLEIVRREGELLLNAHTTRFGRPFKHDLAT